MCASDLCVSPTVERRNLFIGVLRTLKAAQGPYRVTTPTVSISKFEHHATAFIFALRGCSGDIGQYPRACCCNKSDLLCWSGGRGLGLCTNVSQRCKACLLPKMYLLTRCKWYGCYKRGPNSPITPRRGSYSTQRTTHRACLHEGNVQGIYRWVLHQTVRSTASW